MENGCTKGGNRDIINFAEKTKASTVNVVKNEMQSLGMIKVEFSVIVKMAKRNEDGEMTHFDNYMKNEDRVIQNENEIREKVMEFMDEVNNRIENYIENGSEIIFEEVVTAYVNDSQLLEHTCHFPKAPRQESNYQRAE